MFKGFRDFILRGNVVDLAVGVVIGAAFGAVVTAFTKGIIMQFVAALVKMPDFDKLSFYLNGTPINYGPFVTASISFLIISAVIYFMVVLPVNYLMAKFNKPIPAEPPATKTCPECLSDIPLAAKRCRSCGQPVA